MYQVTDAFKHDWHADPDGGNIPCGQCHPKDAQREVLTVNNCDECHTDLIPAGSKIRFEKNMAISYTDAMHKQCISCHQEKTEELIDKKNLTECTACHKITPPENLDELIKWYDTKPSFNRVVVPSIEMEQDEI
jgi:hypothetical protein